MAAVFHCLGTTPSLTDWLNKKATGDAKTGAPSRKTMLVLRPVQLLSDGVYLTSERRPFRLCSWVFERSVLRHVLDIRSLLRWLRSDRSTPQLLNLRRGSLHWHSILEAE